MFRWRRRLWQTLSRKTAMLPMRRCRTIRSTRRVPLPPPTPPSPPPVEMCACRRPRSATTRRSCITRPRPDPGGMLRGRFLGRKREALRERGRAESSPSFLFADSGVERQYMARLNEMRLVQHLAVERGHACTRCERFDHAPSMRYICFGGREGGVDDLHLVGMDGEDSGEAFALGGAGNAVEA